LEDRDSLRASSSHSRCLFRVEPAAVEVPVAAQRRRQLRPAREAQPLPVYDDFQGDWQ
jgi:hypothetical protein